MPPAHGSCFVNPCSALEGGRLNFTCDDGYLLEGVSNLVCLNNAQYTAAVPQCVGETYTALVTIAIFMYICMIVCRGVSCILSWTKCFVFTKL